MVCFVIFRTDSIKKALTALTDLGRYGKVQVYDPKIIPSETVKEIMSDLCGGIKNPKSVNIIAKTKERGGKVIASLKRIHPPAHLIVVTPRYEIFTELLTEFAEYRSLQGFNPPKKILGSMG